MIGVMRPLTVQDPRLTRLLGRLFMKSVSACVCVSECVCERVKDIIKQQTRRLKRFQKESFSSQSWTGRTIKALEEGYNEDAMEAHTIKWDA